MRSVLILRAVAALGLGACENMVVSDEPLLTAADAAPAWTLKPGIWTGESPGGENVCVFDPRRHIRSWPDCAQPMLIEDGSVSALLRLARDKKDWVLAEAEPGLFVAQGQDAKGAVEFGLIAPVERDAACKATVVRLGWLFCGPAPPEGTKRADGQARGLTIAPYPGAILGETNCRPDGREGLLSLARANRESGTWVQIRWWRAPRPDERAPLRRQLENLHVGDAADGYVKRLSPPSPSR